MTIKAAMLKTVAQLRANPALLIAGAFATTARGQRVNPKSPHAACFCALGALYRNLPDDLAPPELDPVSAWTPLVRLVGIDQADQIFSANDASHNHLDFDTGISRWRVGLDGVAKMEEIANDLRE